MYVCNTIAEHTCKCPGCKEVLVIDGNMKNRRDVCMAKDAGYIQYLGLPGHIKSGYTLSPKFVSILSESCSEGKHAALYTRRHSCRNDPRKKNNTFYKVCEITITWLINNVEFKKLKKSKS